LDTTQPTDPTLDLTRALIARSFMLVRWSARVARSVTGTP